MITAAAVAAMALSATQVFDPSGTWSLTATGQCFGSAAYASGEETVVGDDFACSRKLARFSPPATGAIEVVYDPLERAITLTGGPSQATRHIPLDAGGFGASPESYRNETGSLDQRCEVHSFFTEVVQFKNTQMTYAYVDNSEYIPDNSCDASIQKLQTAVAVGRASPGTTALVESGAVDLTRLFSLRQTSIYYLYTGARRLANLMK